MIKSATRKPARTRLGLLHQLCSLISAHLAPRLARDHGIEEKSRTYSPWSHVVSLLFAPLTHAPGLNDAAKCHVRLDLQSFLPHFAIVDTDRQHDRLRARELCAGVKPGEVVIVDKAYIDFEHLADLAARDVFWVARAKDNMQFRVVRKLQPAPDGNILADQVIELSSAPSGRASPNILRRVVARVEVNGELREMVFLTNNFTWSAPSVADFLGTNANAARWQVWTALLAYRLLRFAPLSASGAIVSSGLQNPKKKSLQRPSLVICGTAVLPIHDSGAMNVKTAVTTTEVAEHTEGEG